MHQEIKDSLPGDNRSSERFLYTINRTFNLPSLSDYVLRHTNVSGEIGLKTPGKLPNIKGITDSNRQDHNDSLGGCFYKDTSTHSWYGDNIHYSVHNLGFDASRNSSLYADGATGVRPKSMTLYYIIKY